MGKGFYLTLMLGPGVPVPATQSMLEALQSVQVTVASGRRSGFSLVFSLSNNSPLHTLFLIGGGATIPIFRVVIIVTVSGTSEVLMDGVVLNTRIAPGNDPGHSTLTVMGEDLSAVMDLLDLDGLPYPAMPAEAAVALILIKYAFLGVIPLVIPSILIDVPIPVNRIPQQQGTDFKYVKHLADRVGYVFYIEPGPMPLMNTAYWGPEIRIGVPQKALNINMDAHTNVEQLSFNFNGDNATLPIVTVQNEETRVPIPIPIPPITPLSPPLGLIPPIPKRISMISGTAGLNPIQAVMIGLAKAAQTADVVDGNGTINVVRYGRPLKARQLVGVRGAGTAFDGLYYVKSVTHNIKRGEYKQSFNLVRNALVSNTPRVPA
jgi:hypothetical protein